MSFDDSLAADGFRFYPWIEDGVEHNLLSVTSIKKLCGESYKLVAWQINNVVNVAMGTRAVEVIGPRGGRSKKYVQDGVFPGEFARRLAATKGEQGKLDETRQYLRSTADAPRDMSAIRGTIVHEAIELGATVDMVGDDWITAAIQRLSATDKAKVKKAGDRLRDEDVEFIKTAVAQYWNFRREVPFVLLAREVGIYNLTAGYGGRADALFWFLPEGTPPDARSFMQDRADTGEVTQEDIERVGGHVSLGDWKTGSGPFSEQVIQVMAYLSAEFIGKDNVRDERLTAILHAANEAAIVFVRPGGCEVDFVGFREDVLFAFLGSCVYARFLAAYQDPGPLFTYKLETRLPIA